MTNRTSLTRNLMTACSILALSAVMYGCAGGGDDPVATDVPDIGYGYGMGAGDGRDDSGNGRCTRLAPTMPAARRLQLRRRRRGRQRGRLDACQGGDAVRERCHEASGRRAQATMDSRRLRPTATARATTRTPMSHDAMATAEQADARKWLMRDDAMPRRLRLYMTADGRRSPAWADNAGRGARFSRT